MTRKILTPNNFSHFLIPVTLLSMLIFILIVVVILWISSLLLLTQHCPLSSLTLRFHLLITFLFSVNSVYNHHLHLLLSSISHSDALMPFTFLILFVTFSRLASSTILLLLFQTLLTATISLSVVFLTNMLLLKQRQFILDHLNPGLLLNYMLKKLHAANYRESGLVLILPLILNVYALQ